MKYSKETIDEANELQLQAEEMFQAAQEAEYEGYRGKALELHREAVALADQAYELVPTDNRYLMMLS
jgi:hypothetical protein